MYTLARAPRLDAFAELDRLFDGFLGRAPSNGSGCAADGACAFEPALEIAEDADAYLVRAELPGLAPEDVTVAFEGDALTLRGEKKPEPAGEKVRTHRSERAYGAFARTIRFPAPVDAEQVTATHRHGVLAVRLPKDAKSRARTVKVRTE